MEAVLTLIILLIFGTTFFVALVLLIGMALLMVTRVPYQPTPREIIPAVLDALKLESGQTFYDLGSGDGRVLFAAEERGVKAIGYEISPWPLLRAVSTKLMRGSRAKIYLASFYRAYLMDADRVFCALGRSVMFRVEKKLLEELKPGVFVVTLDCTFPSWNVQQVITVGAHQIYVYRRE